MKKKKKNKLCPKCNQPINIVYGMSGWHDTEKCGNIIGYRKCFFGFGKMKPIYCNYLIDIETC
jgi:hypothetical protein